MFRRRLRSVAVSLTAILTVIAAAAPPALAADDVTAPVGSMELWNMDNETQLAELRLSYSDPESGIDHLLVICDSGPDFNIPYTTKLFWPIHDGTGGCSTEYGEHQILVQAYNGAGLFHDADFASVSNGPTLHLTVSANPTTGHLVTLTPSFPDDFTIPTGAFCRWEFRWGTTQALDVTFTGDTFGGLLFDQPAASGGCGPWTFTLPWVPYRQFDVIVELAQTEPGGGGQVFGPRAHDRFMAAVGSTERRILSSNQPIAQVLPSTYTPIVGQPITYTRYLIGGASAGTNAQWNARLGAGETPVIYTQSGGSTFTFTPSITGDVFVQWYRFTAGGLELLAYYDPPVRYRDRTPPIASAPRERIRPMTVGATVPVAIEWAGTDRGWGIASFQLAKSVNGGAWTAVQLPKAAATSVGVGGVPGSMVRFRVRARDKAGNYGTWVYGPSFRVIRVSDATPAARYTPGAWTTPADPGAFGGTVHETSAAGAATSFTFSGRDVGWIASRGADHGSAKVYIDGAYVQTVSLYAATDQPRQVVFARHWSTVGVHTIRIVNLATAGRPVIDSDGYAVLH